MLDQLLKVVPEARGVTATLPISTLLAVTKKFVMEFRIAYPTQDPTYQPRLHPRDQRYSVKVFLIVIIIAQSLIQAHPDMVVLPTPCFFYRREVLHGVQRVRLPRRRARVCAPRLRPRRLAAVLLSAAPPARARQAHALS